jgi:hypothetical protein
MPDYPIAATTTSSGGMYQYGMIADLRTSNALLSNASPTAGSSAAQTAPSTNDTVVLSDEGRQRAAAMSPIVQAGTKTPLAPIDDAGILGLGQGVLVGTATTQSGRKISITQHDPAPKADDGASPQARPSYVVAIEGTDQQDGQSYLLTGNAIINEDANGALQVAAYAPGRETDGNDVIIGLSAASLSGGAGDDALFDLSPGGGAIQGGAGDDAIIVSGNRRGGTIDAGDGNDAVMIAGGVMDGAIALGDGDDSLQTGNLFGGSIAMGNGNDTLQTKNVFGGNIAMGQGNDVFQAASLSGYVSQLTVDTGDGNDSIAADAIGNGQVNIDTGGGNDRIKAAVIGQAGGQVNIDVGDGNNLIDASYIGLGNSQVNIAAGDGNDSVHASWIALGIGGGASQVNIDAGAGDDSVSSSWIGTGIDGGSAHVNIYMGDGDDSLNASWIGTGINGGNAHVNISMGNGDDSLNASWIGVGIAGGSHVNIDAGNGSDYVNANIVGLQIGKQAKAQAMRDVVRLDPSGHDGDTLLTNASAMPAKPGGNADAARRGSKAYRLQSR